MVDCFRPEADAHQDSILWLGGACKAGGRFNGEYQADAEALETAHHQARRLMINRLRMGYQGPNHPPQLRMA